MVIASQSRWFVSNASTRSTRGWCNVPIREGTFGSAQNILLLVLREKAQWF